MQIASKQISVNSFTYALIISLNFLTFVMGEMFGTGGMAIILSVIVACLLTNVFYAQKLKFSMRWLAMVSLLFVYYHLSQHTDLGNTEFYCYIIIPCIAALYEVDTEKMLRYVTCFSFILLALITRILPQLSRAEGVYDAEQGVMGLSYAILPIVLAGLVHLIFYRKKSNLFLKLCYAIDIVYTVILIVHSNRGVVLTFLIAVMFFYIKKFGSRVYKRTSIFRVIMVMILTVLIINNYIPILEWLNNILLGSDIEVDFVQKTLRMQTDVSNGRNGITEYVVENIFQSPIWGHGISTIYYNSNGTIIYPHNFILQLFYDGGILLAIPVLFFVVKMVWNAIWYENNDKTVFMTFFCLICLPKMFFSTDIWKNPSYWLLLFNYIKFYTTYMESGENENSVFSGEQVLQ